MTLKSTFTLKPFHSSVKTSNIEPPDNVSPKSINFKIKLIKKKTDDFDGKKLKVIVEKCD